MSYCSKCGQQNPDEAQECLHCAAPLGKSCPACGRMVPVESRFCNHCGAQVSEAEGPRAAPLVEARVQDALRALMPESLASKIQAAPEITGERREVTVLFMDIADFTAAAHALDSEEIYLMTDEVMCCAAEVIYEYEGTIDKYTGDGLLALFGLPVAHENDPERAVRAALGIQAALRPVQQKLKQAHGPGLPTRIGIHTGQVIAGRVGNDLHMEYTVIGDTVNLASRLQSVAELDTALVSFETYQRTRPLFQYQTLPSLQIKGKPHPIRAFRPLGLKEKPERMRGLPGMQVPMVGRQDALGSLQRAWAEVDQQGHSRVVLVTGEAGVGKSRLLAEFREHLAQLGIGCYQGSCLNHAQSKPLRLIASLLRDMLYVTETDLAELQRQALRALLDRLSLSGGDTWSYLCSVLGVEEDSSAESRLRHLDSAVLQRLVHAALQQVFLAQARLTPMVLVFEDLHWVGPASRDFLGYLIQTTGQVPLLIVLVSRDTERETVIQPLLRAASQRADPLLDIPLAPLSVSDSEQLVDQLVQVATEEGRAIKRCIVERAEGNPFYAEEMVRVLIDQEGLVDHGGTWSLTPGAEELVREVPGTLNGLIMARFDRLSEELKEALRKAAVLGSSFLLSLLQGLNGATPDEVIAQADALVARQFLTLSPADREPIYAFRHALIQEVVYGTLLKRDRQKLHECAARVIEQSTSGLLGDRTEALAYHYAESSEPSRAVPYLIAAAGDAAHRCAHETAILHYRRALALMADLPGDSEAVLSAQIGLGRALRFVGEYVQAAKILDHALQDLLHLSLKLESSSLLPLLIRALSELAEIRQREGASDEAFRLLQNGQTAMGERGIQEMPQLWRSLVERMAWVRFRQGKLEEAFAMASAAMVAMDATGGAPREMPDDPMTVASLCNTLGGILWQQGNLSGAVSYVERSLELYRSLGYLWGMANAYTNLGVLHYGLGEWPQSADSLQQAEALQQQIGDLQNRAITLNNLGTLRQSMGQHQSARQDLEASLTIRQRLGDNWGVAQARISLARLDLVQGRPADAAAQVRAALDMSGAIGPYEVEAAWILAMAQAEGDLAAGIESARQALQMACAAKLSEQEADCRRVLGSLHTRAGDYLEAESLLRESIDLYLQLNSPYGQGLALLEMGRLYQRMADTGGLGRDEWRARALRSFEDAAERLQRLGAAYDLQVAREAADQLCAGKSAEAFHLRAPTEQASTSAEQLSSELPTGEWRATTVVWVSLNPVTGADEEEVFEAVSQSLSSLVGIVHELQGQEIRRPDGLTAVFGAPVAHEDDAERAVLAAWQMRQYLAESVGRRPGVMQFGVAVSQGDVVTGRIGPRLRSEYSVTGEPVREAQLVAQSAPMDTVWVTEPVRRATERVCVYHAVASDVVSPDGLSLWELVGFRKQAAPARGLPGLQVRLIGREAPLRVMTGLADNLNRRLGGLIWIEGEPGIGKSRLMREFAIPMAERGIVVWAGQCSAQRSGYAFSLFSDLLARAVGVQSADAPEQIRSRLDQVLQGWPRDAQVTRPYLEVLLGIWPSGVPGERLTNLEPEQLRQQIFVSLRRLFMSLASQHPMAVLLDDLHWIDPISAELLQFLLTLVASSPILFVCAQRRQGADLPNDRLVRVQSLIPTQTVNILLDRLSMADRETLLAELLPQAELPAPLRTSILRESEGNPYYLEEYVRMLAELGYVRRHDGRWEIDPNRALEQAPLPSSIETLIRSRLDALPPELKQTMQLASVIGEPFEAPLLHSVSKLPNIEEILSRLESRLLVRRGMETGHWLFHHSLIQVVAYNDMLKAQRRALHLKVGQALEAHWAGAEADHAEELAHHYIQADAREQALVYLMAAGERAAARSANEAAIQYFEQAAQVLSTLSETTADIRWRLVAGLGDVYRSKGRYVDSMIALKSGLVLTTTGELAGDLQAGLYRRLGETAQKQGELELAQRHYDKALAILGQAADRRAHTETARSLTGLAWTHFIQGRFEQARECCEASLEHARSAGALGELAAAENLLGGIYYQQNDWTSAQHHTRRALVLREQMDYTWGVASTLSNLGVLAVQAGEWNKARSFFERSLELRREMGDVEGMATMYNNLGLLIADQGDLAAAERNFRESLDVAMPFRMAFHIANSNVGLAQTLLAQGKVEAGREALAVAQEQDKGIGSKEMLTEICRVQAEILLAESRWDEARASAAQSAALATEIGVRDLQASAYRVMAQIDLRRGDLDAAGDALTRARQALGDGPDRLEAGRVAALAGQVALQQEQFAQAESELSTARQIFMRLGANLDLGQVEDVLKSAVRLLPT